jgi:hypothetical protein
MTPFHTAFACRSFHRTPDWRWRRAEWHLRYGHNYSARRDDEATGRALGYQRAIARCRNGVPSAGVVRRYPAVTSAHNLRVNGGTTTTALEARLLSGQTTETVSRLSGVPAETILEYEALFFDCRGHLNASDWIVYHALAPVRIGGISAQAEAALKSFAFFGGPHVLEAVLPYLIGGHDLFEPPLDLTTLAGRSEQIVRLAVAAQLLPGGAQTWLILQKIMLLIRDFERERLLAVGRSPILTTWIDSANAEGHFEVPSVQSDDTAQPYLAAVVEAMRQAA